MTNGSVTDQGKKARAAALLSGVSIPVELKERVRAVSAQNDMSFDDAVRQALEEFAERWEEFHAERAAIATGEDKRRTVMETGED